MCWREDGREVRKGRNHRRRSYRRNVPPRTGEERSEKGAENRRRRRPLRAYQDLEDGEASTTVGEAPKSAPLCYRERRRA